MVMQSTVTVKGQVTLPSALRKQFGIAHGQKVMFAATKSGILVKPAEVTFRDLTKEKEWRESLEKSLAQVERGEGKFFGSTKEFFDYLDGIPYRPARPNARKRTTAGKPGAKKTP
jgi:AbrB family looped-hinge helix DNA binding protein